MVLKVGSSFKVLGETIHTTSKYLSQEARASFAKSKVKGLEKDYAKLRRDLIVAMDEVNNLKEKVKVLSDDLRAERQLTLEKDEQLQATKERVKTITVEAFQQTKSTIPCSSAGTTKASSSYGDTSSSTLLAWTWRTWTSKLWTKR